MVSTIDADLFLSEDIPMRVLCAVVPEPRMEKVLEDGSPMPTTCTSSSPPWFQERDFGPVLRGSLGDTEFIAR